MALGRRAVLAGAAGVAAGCARMMPVYQPTNVPFSGDASARERSEQIRRAGIGLGWAMEDVRPGLVRGTLNLRTHQAVVDIPYDRQRFSILYASSQNLNFNGSVIHNNYTGWINRLERTIVAQSLV